MKLSDGLIVLGLGVVGALQLFYLREEAATRAPVVAPVIPPVVASSRPVAPLDEPVAVEPAPRAVGEPAAAAKAAPLLGERWMEATVDALLAEHGGLGLTADEVAGLKDVYATCQSVRTTYEAEIAEVLSISGSQAKIRIPPYPVAGARLQQMFNEELKAELGEERYGDVDDYLGDTFEVAFKWFGAAVQELDVELRRDAREGLMYRIVARMDFADTVNPDLGMNETRLFSTTSRYVFAAETVATGEWRPLARHFPRLPDAATALR